MVEHGIVNRYFRNRGFGFIGVLGADGVRTGEEIFFHRANGQWVTDVTTIDGQPIFSGSQFDDPTSSDRMRLPQPHKGDEIIFTRAGSKKYSGKFCASPWGYANPGLQVAWSMRDYYDSLTDEEYDRMHGCVDDGYAVAHAAYQQQ